MVARAANPEPRPDRVSGSRGRKPSHESVRAGLGRKPSLEIARRSGGTLSEQAAHSAGSTEYGARFTCAVARDNLFATQFHPEKSAAHGLDLYKNFLTWSP